MTTLEQYLELKNQGFEFEGYSYLFWEYVRILQEVQPKYFLLENVKMAEKWRNIITKTLGYNPILINSNLLSAQNRPRLYWSNIADIKQPKDKGIYIKDVLQDTYQKGLTVLSLFDGISCGYEALNRAGIKVNAYYASEINATSIAISKYNHPDIIQIGDARDIDISKLPQIDILIGGSPCQNFSFSPKKMLSEKILNRFQPLKSTYCVGTTKPKFRTIGQRDYVFGDDNKMGCLVATDYKQPKQVLHNGVLRKISPIEAERFQTLEDDYTKYGLFENEVKEVSNTKRFEAIGNGWTVDIIAHILKHIK